MNSSRSAVVCLFVCLLLTGSTSLWSVAKAITKKSCQSRPVTSLRYSLDHSWKYFGISLPPPPKVMGGYVFAGVGRYIQGGQTKVVPTDVFPCNISCPIVTKPGQSYPWAQGTRWLNFGRSRSKVKVGGGGMRSTEHPSSYILIFVNVVLSFFLRISQWCFTYKDKDLQLILERP